MRAEIDRKSREWKVVGPDLTRLSLRRIGWPGGWVAGPARPAGWIGCRVDSTQIDLALLRLILKSMRYPSPLQS